MFGPRSQTGSAPDKGSFPLDHFQECGEQAEAYRVCLAQVSNIPKKCKELAAAYLECRMNTGLMEKQPLEDLGFTEENTQEYEDKSGREICNEIQDIMRQSRQRVWREHQGKKKADTDA